MAVKSTSAPLGGSGTRWPPFVSIVDGFPVLNVGALRHQITIMAQGAGSPPVFDAGGMVLGWQEFCSGMAAIEIVRGLDVIRGGQTTTQLFLTIGMWFQPGILPNMTAVHDNGSTYLIQSVENVLEMDQVLVLNCIGLAANV